MVTKTIVALFALLLFAVPETYSAPTQGAMIENGKLIITETRVVQIIPDVPEGLSADDAYKLVTAERPHAFIEGKVAKKSYSVGFLSIHQTIETPRKSVIYRHPGEWVIDDAPATIEEFGNAFSWLFIWIPGLLMGMISLTNVLTETETKRLALFLVMIIMTAVLSGAFGGFSSFGLLLGLCLGMYAGGLATNSNTFGIFAGLLMATLIDVCVITLMEAKNDEELLAYCATMAVIGGLCFLATIGAKSMKGKVQAMLAAKRA